MRGRSLITNAFFESHALQIDIQERLKINYICILFKKVDPIFNFKTS